MLGRPFRGRFSGVGTPSSDELAYPVEVQGIFDPHIFRRGRETRFAGSARDRRTTHVDDPRHDRDGQLAGRDLIGPQAIVE